MNRRDFGKLLAELHEDLRTQITDLKGSVTEAKRLRNSLVGYFEKCQTLINKVTHEETGIETYHNLAVATKEAIDTAKTSADQKLQSITTTLATVQSNITEMEEAYDSFTKINEKLTDEETGLEALLDNAQTLEGQIDTAKTSADQKLQSITTTLATVQSNITEMEEAYDSFTKINEKLTDEETGLEAIKTQAEDLKSEIVAVKSDAGTLYKEIQKFRDNAKAYDAEMEKIKDDADTTLASIRVNHEESNKLKAQINEIFKLGSKGALSNYFVERRNQLFWISFFWVVLALILLVATVWLAVIYILPIANELKNPNSQVGPVVFLLRFAIVTPTLFGALYALKQYSNERRLYEKYAFKTIATYSIEASIGTLVRSISKFDSSDKPKQIINFAISTFTSIYTEPVEPMKDKWVLRGKNSFMDITAEIQQDVGEIRKDVEKLTEHNSDIAP